MLHSRGMVTADERKPIYDLRALARDGRGLFERRARMRAIWGTRRRIPAVDREEIMYAVATANRASYCAFTHRTWAEHAGAPTADLDAIRHGEIGALEPSQRERVQLALAMLAQRIALGGWAPSGSDEGAQDVETVARAMTLANLSGNTLDAFLARLRGDPRADSRVASEVAISALFGLVLLPVGAILVTFRRQTPWKVAREFGRYRRDFDNVAHARSDQNIGDSM